jgi:hypothetical protein
MTSTLSIVFFALGLSYVHSQSNSVLIVHTSGALGDVPTALANEDVSSTLFNASIATPTLPELLTSPCVLVITSDGLLDPDDLGDVLADYVDAGGRVVVAMYSNIGGAAAAVRGRFHRDEMHPIPRGIYDLNYDAPPAGLVPVLPQHTLLNGVNSISCSIQNRPQCLAPLLAAVAPGAVRVANWSTGAPLAAVIGERFNGTIVGLGLHPPVWKAMENADASRLVANAIKFQSSLQKNRIRGDFCDAARTCSSELYCVDSICCDKVCSAHCESCRERNSVGACVPRTGCVAASIPPTTSTPTPLAITPTAAPTPVSPVSLTGLLAAIAVLSVLLYVAFVGLAVIAIHVRRYTAGGHRNEKTSNVVRHRGVDVPDMNYANLAALHDTEQRDVAHYAELNSREIEDLSAPKDNEMK